MEGSIAIGPADRKTLLGILRAALGLRSRRAHIVLLAADGWSVRQIRLATFASFDFIAASVRLYRQRGMAAFAEATDASLLIDGRRWSFGSSGPATFQELKRRADYAARD